MADDCYYVLAIPRNSLQRPNNDEDSLYITCRFLRPSPRTRYLRCTMTMNMVHSIPSVLSPALERISASESRFRQTAWRTLPECADVNLCSVAHRRSSPMQPDFSCQCILCFRYRHGRPRLSYAPISTETLSLDVQSKSNASSRRNNAMHGSSKRIRHHALHRCRDTAVRKKSLVRQRASNQVLNCALP